MVSDEGLENSEWMLLIIDLELIGKICEWKGLQRQSVVMLRLNLIP